MATKVFDLVGEEKMAAKIQALAIKTPIKAAAALFIEANIEATEVRRRIPVDTGTLRGSTEVSKPNVEALGIGSVAVTDIEVAISVGGPGAEYAISVHENLDAFHKVGRAKYLESVIMESAPFITRRLAKRLDI